MPRHPSEDDYPHWLNVCCLILALVFVGIGLYATMKYLNNLEELSWQETADRIQKHHQLINSIK